MAKKPTLIIMAAGMGSRFGGLKQVEKLTDAGEIIIDFSLYDAMMAGFDRAVFVIREEHREIFRELVDERAGRFMDIEYAYQDLEDLPEDAVRELDPEVAKAMKKREKPWGTGHAIYACRKLIDGPFAVINADDYYGPAGFVDVFEFLDRETSGDVLQICTAGYMLANTITENGHVSRGICEVDEDGDLKSIVERTRIMRRPEGIAFTEDEDDKNWEVLPENTMTSMNFWGLPASMMKVLESKLGSFVTEEVPKNPLKSEYLLPAVIDDMIKEGKAKVKVIPCRERWCGVTYREDAEDVRHFLQAKKDSGLYPEKLWK